MTEPDLQGRFLQALTEANTALEVGDLEASSRSVEAVVAACAACGRAGVQLSTGEIATAQRLLDRCNQLANAAQSRLHAEIRDAGALGQATKAYGYLPARRRP